ncbi:processing peptidase [Melioribacter roseus P3M-2]|uniref:Processing peptidase n=1 Tax=Melioribacter roseus (strain DSM 23840 / JCM 17771 / VKM B-2668 / P3M-2) TaxID=1191523 RepID=I6ZR00_MELRP|nr:insulinase family protein [Melioribacter roseus]AFN74484.1 processing peptidase [Melioribacter roseus P3M-2]
MFKKIISLLLIAGLIPVLAQVDRSRLPEPGPAPEIQLGEYESFELPNGLKVFVVENHKLPKVTFYLQVDSDPALQKEQTGYVEAVGELLRTGTKNRTKDKLDEEIDFLGASFSTSADNITASALSKYKDKIFEIMADVIMNSEFKQEELDKVKKQMISSLAASKDEPNAIARRVRSVLMFGKDHPYGELETEETVNAISLDACKNYYQTYFKPNISYLAIVGDISLEEAKQLVEKYLGGWQKGNVPEHKYNTPKPPLIMKVAMVDRANSVQSVISVCYPVELPVGSEDAIKASVANLILGGSATGRLFMNLREDKAYTYGAYSALRPDPIVGTYFAFAQVRNSVTDSAVAEILKEMKRIRSEKVSEDELAKAKNYLTGNFIRDLENPATIARFAVNTARYNLPKDYYKNYLKNLAAVTIDDVYNTAKKYIKPNNAYILVVGSADEVADKLTKFTVTNKIEYYDINGNPYDPTMKKIPEGLTAEQVIRNYVEAVGGADKLAAVKDRTVKMSGSMQGMNVNVTLYQKYPNKLYQEVDAGVFKQKTVFDGEKGYVEAMGQKQELQGDQLESLKNEALDAVLDYSKYGITPELTGMENINGKDAYRVVLTSAGGKKTTQYYDPDTWLLIRSVSSISTPQGSFTQTMDMSDYKEVDGVKYPFKYIQSFGPQSIELNVNGIEINTGLPDSLFEVK